VMSVRLLLKRMEVSRLDVSNVALIFTFSPDSDLEPEKVVKLVERDPKSFQFLSERKFKVNIGKQSALDALLEVKRIIQGLDFAQN
ncbi:MAG: hypothetical protein JSW15_08850, partial [Deltaproteobacteria bacterium]